jgi:hypothetical protein
MKITLSIMKVTALAISCSSLLLVPSRNALGITKNLGTEPKNTISLHEIRVGSNPTASAPPGKALPSNLQSYKRNKSAPKQAPNERGNTAISKREAAAAGTAAATAAALFGTAL